MPRRRALISRPPAGLRGKEIGMYYKSLQMKREKKDKNIINLSLPPHIVSSIYNNLASIEKIAKELNIHVAPIKKLNLIDSPKTADFIPLKSSKRTQYIHNKYQSSGSTAEDDDAIYVETTQSDTVYLSDDDSMAVDSECTGHNESNKCHPNQSEAAIASVKKEKTDDNKPGPQFRSERKENDFFISNNYFDSKYNAESKQGKKAIPNIYNKEMDNLPGTSSPSNYLSINSPMSNNSKNRALSLQGSGDYKYGYEDIITGTFDEKLDECLSKGVTINVTNEEINDLTLAMQEDYMDMVTRDRYNKLMKFREKLPAYQKAKQLLEVINNNQVVVISGETGCGKSTQVPQIILDNAILNSKGANVKILVTQPRRIAASSLAMRVADERGEHMGNSVGYAVRLEKVDPRPRGSILFCTTGILLADLEVNQGLVNYSHVILDEVHERDTHIDLSMCMLKKVLNKRKDLKLILMSATLDADKLSAYFDNCPMLHIEGLAYPVQDIYLEDILHLTKYRLPPERKKNFPSKPWQKHTRKGKAMKASEMEKDIQYKADICPWLESIKKKIDREVYQTLQDSRIEDLNVDLISELLWYICKGPPGAILVFLPGIGDITKLLKILNDSGSFPNSRYEIYPLHSKLPSLEQHKIFQKPPEHIRKIIIATNIAETSITIDDIVYVIDCGKIKYNGLIVEENVSTLKTEWVAQANLRQRRGRAGRCQPGICYHLVTSHRASKLEERLLPEMQRSNLLEPLLAIKRLRLGKVAEAMSLMPASPADATVLWAVKHLQQCGALDDKETLTPLGWHLARLPVHPAAGKLLLLGALFGCLDRAASVAAVWGFKDPFQLVIGKEREVDAAKRRLALGEPSDHVAMSEAIIQWELSGSYQQRRAFAYDNFISMNTVQLLSEMKNQLGGNLKQMGFLSSGNIKSEWENRNASNLSLFKAIVAAALYPNIGTVMWSNLNRRNINKPMRIKIRTPEDGSISLHPSSVMSTKPNQRGGADQLCLNPGANWLVYWLKQRSSDLFLIDVTLVYTLPLLFFGELNVTQADKPEDCYISISSIKVCCKKETTQLLYEMRSLLDQVLASKILASSDCSKQQSKFSEEVLNAVIKLITAEDEGAEYLGDEDDLSESDHSEYEPNRSRYR